MKITYHPRYKTMIVKSDGLHMPPDNFVFGKDTRIVEFDSNMKVKCRIPCELCRQPKPDVKLTDGYCDTCFRAVETSIEDELLQLRNDFKNADRRCTNFNMEGF
jgi:hypothetical protein